MTRRALIAVIAIVLTGCSVGAQAPRVPTYLTQLEPIAREVNDALADTRTVINVAFESDQFFVNAVIDARLGPRLAVERDRLRRLEPSKEEQDDHDRYVALVDDLRVLARDLDAAIADPIDPVAAAIASARLEEVAALGFAGLTAQTCRFASFDLSLCAPNEFFTPAEATAHAAILRAAASVHAFGWIPASVPIAGVPAVAGVAANEIITATRVAADAIETLDAADDRFARLAAQFSSLSLFLDTGLTTRTTGTEVNGLFREMRATICGLGEEFPRPDPMPAEGGTTVDIAGFADVWFAFGGGCPP